MDQLCLALIPVAFLVSLGATLLARRWGRLLNALDGGGVVGQVKAPPRNVPNTGGVGIFAGVAVPMIAGLFATLFTQLTQHASRTAGGSGWFPSAVRIHASGILEKSRDAWIVLGGLFVLHVLGLFDDRRPLGAGVKLFAMITVSAVVILATNTRFLTVLDAHAGGSWLSILLTILWFAVVTNALNFLDNMDGLAAGLGLVAAASFLAVALLREQWFVGAGLALLVGSLAGFLVFNKPPATIFMGDGGSLVVGFLLAFLSVRITYTSMPAPATLTTTGAITGVVAPWASHWHALLTPLVVLAVPLYDFTSVTLLRLAQGKSPFVGDLQHVSHRLVSRGLSRPRAAAVLVGFAGAMGLAGVVLSRADAISAILVGVQVTLVLGVLAVFEFAPGARPTRGT